MSVQKGGSYRLYISRRESPWEYSFTFFPFFKRKDNGSSLGSSNWQ